MAVLQSELVMYRSLTENDTSANGGHRSYNEIPRSSSQNLFGSVFEQERTDGSSTVRFAYTCNHNTSRASAQNMRIWVDNETTAEDYVYFVVKAQGNTAANITGSEQLYSVANLSTDASAGATTLIVTFPTPDAADTYSRTLTTSIGDTDLIRITNKLYPDSTTGTTEIKTV